jgi:hypothetical protein
MNEIIDDRLLDMERYERGPTTLILAKKLSLWIETF